MLVAAGYHRTSLVEERGEVAARGGILDLFPPHLDRPVRLEFDFDEIGSLRHFDPASQRSNEDLHSIVAIPPRAYRLPHELDRLLQRVREMGRAQGVPESNIYALTESLARRHLPPGIENLEALLHEELESLFDYLPTSTLIVVDDPEAGLAEFSHQGKPHVAEADDPDPDLSAFEQGDKIVHGLALLLSRLDMPSAKALSRSGTGCAILGPGRRWVNEKKHRPPAIQGGEIAA